MIGARWEYLSVLWEAGLGAGNPPERTDTCVIWRTGSDPQPVEYTEGGRAIFDALGTEGWELATETILQTAAFPSTRGYSGVTAPISIRWRFKRLVA
jgi:hypothetical protein